MPEFAELLLLSQSSWLHRYVQFASEFVQSPKRFAKASCDDKGLLDPPRQLLQGSTATCTASCTHGRDAGNLSLRLSYHKRIISVHKLRWGQRWSGGAGACMRFTADGSKQKLCLPSVLRSIADPPGGLQPSLRDA